MLLKKMHIQCGSIFTVAALFTDISSMDIIVTFCWVSSDKIPETRPNKRNKLKGERKTHLVLYQSPNWRACSKLVLCSQALSGKMYWSILQEILLFKFFLTITCMSSGIGRPFLMLCCFSLQLLLSPLRVPGKERQFLPVWFVHRTPNWCCHWAPLLIRYLLSTNNGWRYLGCQELHRSVFWSSIK